MTESVETALWNALTAQGLADQPNGELLRGEIDMHRVTRAVLQAMLDPDDKALGAGINAVFEHEALGIGRTVLRYAWQAIIRATLLADGADPASRFERMARSLGADPADAEEIEIGDARTGRSIKILRPGDEPPGSSD